MNDAASSHRHRNNVDDLLIHMAGNLLLSLDIYSQGPQKTTTINGAVEYDYKIANHRDDVRVHRFNTGISIQFIWAGTTFIILQSFQKLALLLTISYCFYYL
ncbi:hypothetical protein DERP_009572 [Dermatophagoides pteronyssinus]|uniref:Uncharacterized protein n=1 Tax=Dermatophagoides pteronyssinus TaxID=6956 RepID=A0ABQ8JAT3_DERPT|nr:hypothetical protein DERP_009572 [Dermatophagoides pteronyssinus]